MKTISLVTLYFPDENVKKNISQLSHFVDNVVLLDNTPDSDNSGLFAGLEKTEYIAYKENLGLSEAFNRYLKSLKENSYIIFFDQDSFCPENFIEQLKNDYSFCCRKLGKKGIIGPAYFEKNANQLMIPKQKKEISEGIYQVKSIITSGMFTELEVLQKIGFWNEEIFLDMADWDLCWRVLKNNFFCCLTRNVVLAHRLGKGVRHVAGIKVKEGAPFRVYYQTRDCLYLLRRNYVPLKFRIRLIQNLTVRSLLHLIVLPDKIMRIHYYIKGIMDFKNKIHGVLSENI
mgnify:FL=1